MPKRRRAARCEWRERKEFQIAGCWQKAGVKRVREIAARSAESESTARHLRARTGENEIVNGVRLIARNRCAGRLEHSNSFAIPGPFDTRDQVAAACIRCVERQERSARGDAGAGVVPVPQFRRRGRYSRDRD